MLKVASILFGALFTVAVAAAAGKLLLRRLRITLYREEEQVFAFIAGSACLSLLVFLLAMLRLARPGVFLALGLLIVGWAVWCGAHRAHGPSLPPLDRHWAILFAVLLAVFGVLYFVNAMAPEHSPDGASYHLGVVSRYLRAHGFYRITTNMYANLSQGAELLFLFAFAFGRHSAAALVHFAFLVALTFAMLFYGRRFGFPRAGTAAALFVFISPIVGYDGSTAYIDVAAACVVFAAFYLLQMWDRERTPALLIPIGLLAGFAYAIKYTALPAVPYTLAFVGWRLSRKPCVTVSSAQGRPAFPPEAAGGGRAPLLRKRKAHGILRPLVLTGTCALLMMLPWVARNWIWLGNPFSPFFNNLFPNPYVHIQFEKEYRQQLANWGELNTKWDIPLEATVRGGRLQGLLGPVFLLLPVSLLALRRREGRQLLLAAAIFLLLYPANIGTRFLIPPLPFLSLALGLVVASWKYAAPALVLFHAVTSSPAILQTYCDQYALRLEDLPVRAALRLEPEDAFLEARAANYALARLLEEKVPAEAKVFAYSGLPEAYTSRDILVGYQAAWNNSLGDILWTPLVAEWLPTRRLVFRFEAQALRRIRVVQTAAAPDENFSIYELRAFHGKDELAREPQWRLRAHPNPWEVQYVFDNSPVTRWRSWEPLFPGMFVEVDFGRRETIDSVMLACPAVQNKVRLRLEGQLEPRAWRSLAGEPDTSEAPPPPQLRRMAAEEVKWEGVEYLLIRDSDLVAEDIRRNRAHWGITLVAEKSGTRLYRID